MLVLQRKKGEKIVINNDIELTVIEIGKGFVRLGIVAPKQVSVHRQEIFLRLSAQERPGATIVSAGGAPPGMSSA